MNISVDTFSVNFTVNTRGPRPPTSYKQSALLTCVRCRSPIVTLTAINNKFLVRSRSDLGLGNKAATVAAVAAPAEAKTERGRSPPPPELRQGRRRGGPPTQRPAQRHPCRAPDATGKLAALAPPRLVSTLASSRSEGPGRFFRDRRVYGMGATVSLIVRYGSTLPHYAFSSKKFHHTGWYIPAVAYRRGPCATMALSLEAARKLANDERRS